MARDSLYQVQHVLLPSNAVTTPTDAPMTAPDFVFNVRFGEIRNSAGILLTGGVWAGQGAGRNNPAMMSVHAIGPLPTGTYHIGFPIDMRKLGPYVLHLEQQTGETYGRSGFFIHGPSATHRDTSSEGCLILDRPFREAINKGCGPNRLLQVVP